MDKFDYISTRKENCPQCGSKDNLAIWTYPNGIETRYCYTPGCGNQLSFANAMKGKMPKVYELPQCVPFRNGLASRKLNAVSMERYQVKYVVEEGHQYKGCIAFPYHKEMHQITAVKYRVPSTQGKRMFWDGEAKSPPFFGRHSFTWKNESSVIITEGEFDAIAAYQLTGIPALSVPTGADGAARTIKANLQWLEKTFKKIYIAMDNDVPGDDASLAIMELIQAGKAYRVILPQGIKDVGEILEKGLGADVFLNALDNAESVECEYLASLETRLEWVDRYYNHVDDLATQGMKVGIKELDDCIRLREGEITTIFSDPAVGKSSLVRQIAANQLIQGNNVLLLPYEEMAYRYYGKVLDMTGTLNGERMELIKEKLHSGKAGNIFDLRQLADVIEYGVRMKDVKLVVLDNITAYVSGQRDTIVALRNTYNVLINAATTYNCHIIVVSHTKRSNERTHDSGKMPHFDDSYGSSSLEQFSDNIIALSRKEGTHIVNARIYKQRANGETGDVEPITFDPATRRFANLTVGTNRDDNSRRLKQKEEEVKSPEKVQECGLPNRQREDVPIRLEDGTEDKFSLRVSNENWCNKRRRSYKQPTEAIYSDYYSTTALQSRLPNHFKRWFGNICGGQRELTRIRQGEITESSRITETGKFVTSMYRRYPIVTQPKGYELSSVGGEVRDAIYERERLRRLSEGVGTITRGILEEFKRRAKSTLEPPEEWYLFPELYIPLELMERWQNGQRQQQRI